MNENIDQFMQKVINLLAEVQYVQWGLSYDKMIVQSLIPLSNLNCFEFPEHYSICLIEAFKMNYSLLKNNLVLVKVDKNYCWEKIAPSTAKDFDYFCTR